MIRTRRHAARRLCWLICSSTVATSPHDKESAKKQHGWANQPTQLRLVAEGLSDAEVAARLLVSLSTVKMHLRSIYGKLGVPSRNAATRFALEHRLA